MEDKINQIHQLIKALYPESVSVDIFVNSEGIEVAPKYRANLEGISMKDINGNWVKNISKPIDKAIFDCL